LYAVYKKIKPMKTSILLASLIILFFLSGCDNRLVPLRGNYPDRSYEISIASTKEQVWNKAIEILLSRGYAIKFSDKNSGVITTDNISFLNAYTWETKDGDLINPNAFVVCTRFRGAFTFAPSIDPHILTGQWAILIKQENDQVVLNISLANAVGKIETYNLTVKSTGVFEQLVRQEFR
jgi:hypothetical protein